MNADLCLRLLLALGAHLQYQTNESFERWINKLPTLQTMKWPIYFCLWLVIFLNFITALDCATEMKNASSEITRLFFNWGNDDPMQQVGNSIQKLIKYIKLSFPVLQNDTRSIKDNMSTMRDRFSELKRQLDDMDSCDIDEKTSKNMSAIKQNVQSFKRNLDILKDDIEIVKNYVHSIWANMSEINRGLGKIKDHVEVFGKNISQDIKDSYEETNENLNIFTNRFNTMSSIWPTLAGYVNSSSLKLNHLTQVQDQLRTLLKQQGHSFISEFGRLGQKIDTTVYTMNSEAIRKHHELINTINNVAGQVGELRGIVQDISSNAGGPAHSLMPSLPQAPDYPPMPTMPPMNGMPQGYPGIPAFAPPSPRPPPAPQQPYYPPANNYPTAAPVQYPTAAPGQYPPFAPAQSNGGYPSYQSPQMPSTSYPPRPQQVPNEYQQPPAAPAYPPSYPSPYLPTYSPMYNPITPMENLSFRPTEPPRPLYPKPSRPMPRPEPTQYTTSKPRPEYSQPDRGQLKLISPNAIPPGYGILSGKCVCTCPCFCNCPTIPESDTTISSPTTSTGETNIFGWWKSDIQTKSSAQRSCSCLCLCDCPQSFGSDHQEGWRDNNTVNAPAFESVPDETWTPPPAPESRPNVGTIDTSSVEGLLNDLLNVKTEIMELKESVKEDLAATRAAIKSELSEKLEEVRYTLADIHHANVDLHSKNFNQTESMNSQLTRHSEDMVYMITEVSNLLLKLNEMTAKLLSKMNEDGHYSDTHGGADYPQFVERPYDDYFAKSKNPGLFKRPILDSSNQTINGDAKNKTAHRNLGIDELDAEKLTGAERRKLLKTVSMEDSDLSLMDSTKLVENSTLKCPTANSSNNDNLYHFIDVTLPELTVEDDSRPVRRASLENLEPTRTQQQQQQRYGNSNTNPKAVQNWNISPVKRTEKSIPSRPYSTPIPVNPIPVNPIPVNPIPIKLPNINDYLKQLNMHSLLTKPYIKPPSIVIKPINTYHILSRLPNVPKEALQAVQHKRPFYASYSDGHGSNVNIHVNRRHSPSSKANIFRITSEPDENSKSEVDENSSDGSSDEGGDDDDDEY